VAAALLSTTTITIVILNEKERPPRKWSHPFSARGAGKWTLDAGVWLEVGDMYKK
jgi:hypothetical protein